MIQLLTRRPSYRGQSTAITHRWFVASSGRVKVLMGLRPEAKWPTDGLWPRVIQGVMIRVQPLKAGRKRHRVLGECPVCGKVTSLGRLGQHLNVHPEYNG